MYAFQELKANRLINKFGRSIKISTLRLKNLGLTNWRKKINKQRVVAKDAGVISLPENKRSEVLLLEKDKVLLINHTPLKKLTKAYSLWSLE
jgi:hypothetical protein